MTKEIKQLDGEWYAAITSLLPIAPPLSVTAIVDDIVILKVVNSLGKSFDLALMQIITGRGM